MGHAATHLPHPMHTLADLLSHSLSLRNNREEEPFPVHTFREKTGSPIIGPPATMRAQSSLPPQNSARSRYGVPFFTQLLQGLSAPFPLTVITRS